MVAFFAACVFAAGASAAPLVVRATFDTPTVQFGDAIRTRIVVVLDGNACAVQFAQARG